MKLPEVSVVCTSKKHSIENFSRCLTQLVSQNRKNIEILVIDDGFDMEDSQELDKMCALDPRIRLIHRYESSGVGAARNLGIRRARGVFITFVDFDDYLSDMFCWIMADMMKDFGAEIAICGILKEAGEIPDVGYFKAKHELVDDKEKASELGVSVINKGMPGGSFEIEGINLAGAKMYRRDFILDCPWVVFPEGANTDSDGMIFLLRALDAEPIVLMVDVPLYMRTKDSVGRNPGNDPNFAEHEEKRLQRIDSETGMDPERSKATAREALCSLLRIEYSLKNTKISDAKDYLRDILNMEVYSDALKMMDDLGFKSRDLYLLELSRAKRVVQILKEVTRKTAG